jgi:hypothetical protein
MERWVGSAVALGAALLAAFPTTLRTTVDE